MGKNTGLLLVLGAIALYLYEQHKNSGGNSQIPCAAGFTNVNGTCVANPFTSDPSGGQIPCAAGYVAYFTSGGQTCIPVPTTDPIPVDNNI